MSNSTELCSTSLLELTNRLLDIKPRRNNFIQDAVNSRELVNELVDWIDHFSLCRYGQGGVKGIVRHVLEFFDYCYPNENDHDVIIIYLKFLTLLWHFDDKYDNGDNFKTDKALRETLYEEQRE